MRKYYYIKKNEFWWFGNVADGYAMPFSEKLDYELNFLVNRTYNQVNPLLVSSHGRYIYIEGDCIVSVTCGVITISEASGAIYSGEGSRDCVPGIFLYFGLLFAVRPLRILKTFNHEKNHFGNVCRSCNLCAQLMRKPA